MSYEESNSLLLLLYIHFNVLRLKLDMLNNELSINQISKHVVSKVSFGSAFPVNFTGKRDSAGHENTTVQKMVFTEAFSLQMSFLCFFM